MYSRSVPSCAFLTRSAIVVSLGVCALAACEARPAPVDASVGWVCPPGWVAHRSGGCAPASILCAPGGSAAPGACANAPRDDDAGTVPRMWRVTADGSIAGDWPAVPPTLRIPPARPRPVVGTTACPAGWTLSDGACDPGPERICGAFAGALPGGRCTATDSGACGAPGSFPDAPPEATGASVRCVRIGADDAIADGTPTRPFGTFVAALRVSAPDVWLLLAAGTFREAIDTNTRIHIVGSCARSVALESPAGDAVIRAQGIGSFVNLRDVSIVGGGLAFEDGATGRIERVVVRNAVARGLYVTGAGSRVDVRDFVVRDTRADVDGARGRGVQVSRGAQLIAQGVSLSGNHDVGVIVLDGATVTMRDAWITRTLPNGSAPATGISVGLARAELAEVVSDANVGIGLRAYGAGTTVAVASSAFRSQRATGVPFAHGVEVQAGASVQIAQSWIHDNDEGGVVVHGQAALTLAHSVVSSTRPRSDGTLGRGVDVLSGARATLESVWLRSNADVGAYAHETGSVVTLRMSLVSDTQPNGNMYSGFGIAAQEGARAEVYDSVVVGGRVASVYVRDPGSAAQIERCWLEGTQPAGPMAPGQGVSVRFHATATVLDTAMIANRGLGASVDNHATGDFVGCLLADTEPLEMDRYGAGIGVSSGGHATISGGVLRGNSGGAAYALVDDSVLEIRDSAIIDTRARHDMSPATAIACHPHATIRVERVLLARNPGGSALADGVTAELHMTDVRIEDSLRLQQRFGHGVAVQHGGRATLERVLIERSGEFGASAMDGNSQLVLHDVIVRDSLESERGYGGGIGIFGHSLLTADRLAIVRVRGGGVIASSTYFRGAVYESDARIDARDVYVGGVGSSSVRPLVINDPQVLSRPVAYGLHVGADGAGSFERVVVESAGLGLFSSGGGLTLTDGVIVRSLDGAASTSAVRSMNPFVLVRVRLAENASDEITFGAELPEATLPSPTPICLGPDCP